VALKGGRTAGNVMVARNWEDYYHVALRLATTPYVYEKTRHALIHARATCALYDTQKWVREWQRGVRILWETRLLVDEGEGGLGDVGQGASGGKERMRRFHAVVARRLP